MNFLPFDIYFVTWNSKQLRCFPGGQLKVWESYNTTFQLILGTNNGWTPLNLKP